MSFNCPAATDGFPYEHLHRCTKRHDHKLHDEPDNDVHLCSCGARWRPHRLDRATHPRRDAYAAARRWAAQHQHQTPDDRMLALVYEAGYGQGEELWVCGAFEPTPPDRYLPYRCTEPYGHDGDHQAREVDARWPRRHLPEETP